MSQSKHMSVNTKEIEKYVIYAFEKYLEGWYSIWDFILRKPKSQPKVSLNDYIIKDLGVDTEDAIDILLDIQKKYKIKFQKDEFPEDIRIRELIAIVVKHLENKNSIW